MRRSQMMAIAALMTATAAPYVVNAEAVPTANTTYIEQGVAFAISSDDNFAETTSTESYFKSNFFGKVDLEISAQGKFAVVTLQGHAYGFEKLVDTKGKELEIISTTGSAADKNLVRVVKVALDEKYQASIVGESKEKGNTQFNLDLSQESFDFDFDLGEASLNTYFKAWLPNADVVTLQDGSKVAYVTFAGHSYGVAEIFEGKDKTTAATVVLQTGSAEAKDLTRVVKFTLDKDNKAYAFIPSERGDYTISFDFSDKEAVPNFATAKELTTAKALKVEYGAVDAKAGSWHPMAFPSSVLNPTAKVLDGKIEVSFETKDVKSFKATQNGKELAVKLADNKATFTVDTLEGIAFEVTAVATRGETKQDVTYNVTLNKAQVDAAAVVEEKPTTEEKPAQTVTIPSTTNVEKKKATYKLEASTSSLTNYFKDFFGAISIVEIDGKVYADLGIQNKAFGLSFDYITESGTTADVVEVAGNRAQHSAEKYEGFNATLRVPVTVANDKFTVKLETEGGQPGSGKTSTYQFTFTGALQHDVKLPYSDVKNAETAEYVQLLANWGGLNLNVKNFNAGKEIARGQFALIVARTLDLQATGTMTFKDVKHNAELQNAAQALAEIGIVKAGSTFKPNAKLTREEAAVLLYNVLTKKLGYQTTATVNDLNFNDASEVSSAEAKLAIAALQKEGIMTGSQGFINPTEKLTRAQMTKMVVKSLQAVSFEK